MSDNWLIFVDTNILLDFYRLRGASAVKYLSQLEEKKHFLILTEQVQMEFLKHRQRVVAEALTEIKKPTEQKFPPFLDQYQPSQMMKSRTAEAVQNHKKVQEKIERIIEKPMANDEVFKHLNRIFKHDGPYALTRKTTEKLRIRSLARKRFSLGYPPRKKDDTSMGDSVNWEWIVNCARNCPNKSNVIIVSRDGDFGITRNKKYILNDWLKKEFVERVSKKRKVELTELLSVALKKLDVKFTKDEEREELEVVSSQKLVFDEDVFRRYAEAQENFNKAVERAKLIDPNLDKLNALTEIFKHLPSKGRD